MGQFDELMSELQQLGTDQEQMAKALPTDDGADEEKIQAAAAEGGLGEGETAGGDAGEGDEKPMAKSFKITLEDGTEIEAQDGAEMVKALGDRLSGTETAMAKALGEAVGLIKGQADMIKSLSDRVAKLAGEGRGRKAVLSVVEKPAPTVNADTMAKSLQPDGMTPDVFFAKALTAQAAGRLSGTDIAVAEASLNRGEPIPAHIVQRVMA